jgi:type IV pilus assembly protein PilA
MAPMRRHSAGFTWIELVLVLAVFAILAALALPSLRDTTVRTQVKEGLALADVAKGGVQAAWTATGEMPADNEAAGIPPRDKIVGNLVREVSVKGGAITVTFGNNATKLLEGKRVTLRPAVVADQPRVPIAWLCHDLPVPGGMEAHGKDETDVEPPYLPVDCRGAAPSR